MEEDGADREGWPPRFREYIKRVLDIQPSVIVETREVEVVSQKKCDELELDNALLKAQLLAQQRQNEILNEAIVAIRAYNDTLGKDVNASFAALTEVRRQLGRLDVYNDVLR